MDDEDLLSGDGTAADFLNSTGADAIYDDNQTAADMFDNGAVTSSSTSTTVSNPAWQNSLMSLFSVASAGLNTVSPLLGSTTGAKTAATPAAGSATASKIPTLWIVLAVAGAALLFLLKRK
jgi:hypothetical protein